MTTEEELTSKIARDLKNPELWDFIKDYCPKRGGNRLMRKGTTFEVCGISDFFPSDAGIGGYPGMYVQLFHGGEKIPLEGEDMKRAIWEAGNPTRKLLLEESDKTRLHRAVLEYPAN